MNGNIKMLYPFQKMVILSIVQILDQSHYFHFQEN